MKMNRCLSWTKGRCRTEANASICNELLFSSTGFNRYRLFLMNVIFSTYVLMNALIWLVLFIPKHRARFVTKIDMNFCQRSPIECPLERIILNESLYARCKLSALCVCICVCIIERKQWTANVDLMCWEMRIVSAMSASRGELAGERRKLTDDCRSIHEFNEMNTLICIRSRVGEI